MREEDLYELATDELNSRNRKADLWARACALATDDVDEARYLYTNLRVEELANEHKVDLTQANLIPPQELSDLKLSTGDVDDETTSLTPEHTETLSQRIPHSDDESNLTPAQLALKRVSESMSDSTGQLTSNLSPIDDTNGVTGDTAKIELADKQPSEKADYKEKADNTELSIDDSFLSQPSAAATNGETPEAIKSAPDTADKKAPLASMVLGDLTTDSSDEADNTIHIDAQSPLDQAIENNPDQSTESLSLTTEPRTDATENIDYTANSEIPANANTEEKNQGVSDDNSLGGSMAALSLSDLLDNPQPLAAKTPNSSGITSNAGSPLQSHETTETTSEAAPEVEEFKLPDSATQTGTSGPLPVAALKTELDEGNDDDLHELIGNGEEAVEESQEVDESSPENVDKLPDEELTETEFDANNADSIAAMQDAGPQLSREFAIYQNSSGIVSAVPKGGNLKAMFFTLPWLLSRKLWGHSLVYLLLLLVLFVAVLTSASLVYSQWPEVATLDLAAAGFFAVLAVIGLFLLPYKLANKWQEQKIAKQGFQYKSDQLASTLAGAEQSFLLGSKNRIETIETASGYAAEAA